MSPAAPPLSDAARALLGHRSVGTGAPVVAVPDPANGGVLAELGAGVDAEQALRGARRSLERGWSRLSGAQRGRHLLALARAIRDHGPALAELESRDTGTPLGLVREQALGGAVRDLLHHAGWADKLAHARRGPDGGEARPLGVTVHLVPASSSLTTALRTLAPALAAGNTAVLLAPEHSPLAAVAIGGLAARAGWPDGVLGVLVGPGATRSAVLGTPGADAVVVTGPVTEVASVQRTLVGTGIDLITEVTAPVSTILFADAPVTEALEHVVVQGVMGHGRLGGGSRLLIEDPGYDSSCYQDVVHRLHARLAALTVGHPTDPGTDVGPLGSGAQRDAAARRIEAEVRGGAHRWSPPRPAPTSGAYLAPTVLADLPVPLRGQQEIAGPVIGVHRFTGVDDALARTDPLGRVSVWTASRATALAVTCGLGPGASWADPAHAHAAEVPAAIGSYLADA